MSDDLCSTDGCEEPRFCRGLCKRHYWRMKDARRHRPRDDALLRTRARNRAVARLIDNHPDEFAELFAAEKAAADVEAEELAAAAAEREAATSKKQVSSASPAPAPAARQPVRLMTGPRPADQRSVDRIRPDVARCARCHGFHDSGHRCAECGSAPKEDTA